MSVSRPAPQTMGTCPVLRVVAGPDYGRLIATPRGTVGDIGTDATVELGDTALARKHLEYRFSARGVEIRDLGSAHGTRMAGELVEPGVWLRVPAGGTVEVGRSVLLAGTLVVSAGRSARQEVVVEEPERRQHLPLEGPVVIGRDPGQADIVVRDKRVSGRHLELRNEDGVFVAEDLGSTNGSWMGDRCFRGEGVSLKVGQVIRLGDGVRVSIAAGGEPAQTVTVVLEVEIEGFRQRAQVLIEARSDARVSDVASAIASLVGATEGGPRCMYRREDGLLAAPEVDWIGVGASDGERWVLGEYELKEAPTGMNQSSDVVGVTGTKVTVARRPRTDRQVPASVIEPPAPPIEHRREGAVWTMLGGAGGILTAIALIALRDDTQSRLFALIIGATGLLTLLSSVMADRARRRSARRRFDRRFEEFELELSSARSLHVRQLRRLHPRVRDLVEREPRSDPIWTRRPSDADWLALRLGTGPIQLPISTKPVGRDADPDARDRITEAVSAATAVDGGPVVIDIDRGELVVVTGDADDAVDDFVRGLVVQIASLHPPSDLSVSVVGDSSWSWAAWLPHTEANSCRLVFTSDDDVEGTVKWIRTQWSTSTQRLLVVVRPNSAGLRLAEEVLADGGTVVAALRSLDQAPGDIGVWVALEGNGGRMRSSGATLELTLAEGIEGDQAAEFARRLAPCRYGAGATSPDRSSGTSLDSLGIHDVDGFDPRERWSSAGKEAAVVGHGDDGSIVEVDLTRDGPHIMIAGATRSGKSEFIKTLLASLAIQHGPDRLNFFLIDFKGGSTFLELGELPHTVGVVTDLEADQALAQRAFSALDAEIRRRKQLFDAARVQDFDAYEGSRNVGSEPLPSLVVLIDEFALLKTTHPELAARLDTVASQGGSLGIHLVLATQNPLKAISDAINTNTNLRVCFRVATPDQSTQLLGTGDASEISTDDRGRAFIRRGAERRVKGFQGLYLGGPVRRDIETPVTVRRVGPPPAHTHTTSPDAGDGPSQLEALCDRLIAAGDRQGAEAVSRLWLPPLDHVIRAGALSWPGRPNGVPAVMLGVADDPQRQRQFVAGIDLTQVGHVAAMGMFGSGKTTLLNQVATDLAVSHDAGEVHIYGVDAGDGSLAGLEALPHVGAVIAADDHERLSKLWARLARVVDRRRRFLSANPQMTFRDWRGQGADEPWIVLLIDDHALLREVLDHPDHVEAREAYQSLLRRGPAMGIHAVVTMTQEADMPRSLLTLMGARVLFRLLDASEYSRVRRMSAVPDWGPGRCIVEGLNAEEVQIARPDNSSITAPDHSPGPAPIKPLPTEIGLLRLIEQNPDLTPRPFLVGGSENQPIGVDLTRLDAHLLVIGAPGTGRSTALEAFAVSRRTEDPNLEVIVTAGPLGPGFEPLPWMRVLDDPGDVIDIMSQRPPSGRLFLIDDVEQIPADVIAALGPLLREAKLRGFTSAIAGRTTELQRAYDDSIRFLTSLRTALLLAPDPDTEMFFGLKPMRPRPIWPQGRGLLVLRGQPMMVQVAKP